MQDKISIIGARANNLKNIDVDIPRGSLTVITGLSGSGKSSLAFDTIYAEGQRRYIDTFSAYARGFLGTMERPDVDKISGLSPVISIEQKTTNKNPRSTVGTTTEIYDYLRLLYARAADAFSWQTGEPMVKYTEEQICQSLISEHLDHRVMLMAPLVSGRKGHYRELFEQVRRKGFMHVRVDGELMEVEPGMRVDRYVTHTIEVVVDKLRIKADDSRVHASVATALRMGEGQMMVADTDAGTTRHYSRRLMCPTTGMSYADPAPPTFSFNTPAGWCPTCKGLGFVHQIDIDKIIPDPSKSIREGGIAPLGKYKNEMIFWQMEAILAPYGATLDTPLADIPEGAIDEILHGANDRLRIPAARAHTQADYYIRYEGLVKYIEMQAGSDASATAQRWAEQFSKTDVCPECHGARLNREALHFRIAGKNIAELADMDISELRRWTAGLEPLLTPRQRTIATEILKEIRSRLDFLCNVGLDYLSLSRTSMSLSGGESQRIRLATQIGARLVGVLYILDEPSIGLHWRDNLKLIHSLQALRDSGNTVIVVEHDEEMMRHADYIVDMGPRAGRRGGEVVFQGTFDAMMQTSTLTADYLHHRRTMPAPPHRHGSDQWLRLLGASGNNLRHVDVAFPLGTMVCVTGVSGSGKSTLINDTLHPILSQHFYRSLTRPLPYDSIEGLDLIDKVVDVDQSPIGRTPRSNPATYTGVFTDIRNLFGSLPEARIRGYKSGRFSFNVSGGRCETCGGAGYKTIEMHFLPDVTVPCETCGGRRYNRETLEVRYKGKSIADVLDMTINQAVEFFAAQPSILQKIKTLQDVGLGYIKLGQSSTTLSGGESQRVKLATELAKRDTGHTLYILDEPTTGLHFEDIRVLLSVLQRLVDKGNTVIIIEHNLDVVRAADYIIELGPAGGRGGGSVVRTYWSDAPEAASV